LLTKYLTDLLTYLLPDEHLGAWYLSKMSDTGNPKHNVHMNGNY